MNPDRKAEIFVKMLSRAPLVPIALATPAAFVMSAAELGIVHAGGGEGDCQIRVETYNPNTGSAFNRLIGRNVTCDAILNISIGVENSSVKKLDILTPEEIQRRADEGRNEGIKIILGALALVGLAFIGRGLYDRIPLGRR